MTQDWQVFDLGSLGEPGPVRYFFDVGRGWIGIKKESPDCEQAFPIRKKTNGQGGGLVRAGHFCNRYGIQLEDSIRFENIRVDADGMLILDLKTARRIRR